MIIEGKLKKLPRKDSITFRDSGVMSALDDGAGFLTGDVITSKPARMDWVSGVYSFEFVLDPTLPVTVRYTDREADEDVFETLGEEETVKDDTTTKHPPGHVPFSERVMAGLARERIIAGLKHRASADILDQAKKTYARTREDIDIVNSKLARMAREGFKSSRNGTPMIRMFVPKDSMVEATIVSVDVTPGNPVVSLYAIDVVAEHPMTGFRGGPALEDGGR